jgi:DNA-binding helix-hairpin-helix protein with protein kinase domain
MEKTHMMRAQTGRVRRLRTIVVAVAVLGFMTVIYLPFSLAQLGDNVEQKIRQAKAPADHQALAALYEQEAQAARQEYAKHIAMRDAYTAIPVLREKGKADAHCQTIANKYEMAKEFEELAAIHKQEAEQAR